MSQYPRFLQVHKLFNDCVNLAYYPRYFKKSITLVLQKLCGEEPRDYTSAKAYRPIALLNTLGKALESVLATRIRDLVETYALLPDTHIGGRRGRSTEDALHKIVEKIYSGWNKDGVASLLMLNIWGAYDHVCQHRLRHNLRKRHLNLQLVDLISSFLSDRVTSIRSNEFTSAELHISCGIPQGSPLSSILFLFYNADLLEKCSSVAPGLSVNAFIDDTTLCAFSPSTEENCKLLASAHDKCLDWARTHGAVFAPSKYPLIHLSRKKSINNLATIDLGSQLTVSPKSTAKLLGIILDSQLAWKPQVEHVRNKSMKSVGALSKLGALTWGGSLLKLRQIYLAVIVPQLTYACRFGIFSREIKGIERVC